MIERNENYIGHKLESTGQKIKKIILEIAQARTVDRIYRHRTSPTLPACLTDYQINAFSQSKKTIQKSHSWPSTSLLLLFFIDL